MPAEVIAEVFPKLATPPPSHVVDDVFPQAVDSKRGTKEDIIGFSNGEDDEHSNTDESIDIGDKKTKCEISSCYR